MTKLLVLHDSLHSTWQQGCARDLLSQDRDVQNFVWDETETRRCSFQDNGRDLEAPEALESLGSFNISPRHFSWQMVPPLNTDNSTLRFRQFMHDDENKQLCECLMLCLILK